MFYRRKVLLALVEVFGGTLQLTDCQKLLFLFCQRSNKNFYDFFPYKYGGFSILSYQDKSRLTQLEFLKNVEDFQLATHKSFYQQLQPEDQIALQDLVKEVGTLQGNELIRKIYLEFPKYAKSSKILPSVLKSSEVLKVSESWYVENNPCLFTIGYEGISIDAYLNLLISNNVAALIDVRKNPVSMKYGFSKKNLANYCEKIGIKYSHLPDLGIDSALRQNLETPEEYHKLFEHYASRILPKQTNTLEELKNILQENGRVALTCFEAEYLSCHRHKIVEYLQSDPTFDISVNHINSKAQNLDKAQEINTGLFAKQLIFT